MGSQIDRLVSLICAIRKLTHEQVIKKGHKTGSILQAMTLKYIQEKKPLMKEISGFLTITPPSATSLIDTLTKAGLVKRLMSKGDRRAVRLEVTVKGKSYLKRVMKEIEKRMRKNLKVLTPRERKNLEHILSKIIKTNN